MEERLDPDAGAPNRGDFLLGVLLAVVLLVAFVTVGALVQTADPPFGLWFTEVFIFFGVTWLVLRGSGRDPVRYPRLVWPGAAPVAMGLLAGVANFLGVVVPLQAAALKLFPPWLIELSNAARIFENLLPIELGLVVGAVGLAAPLCEEYFFRGVLQRGLVNGGTRPARAIFAAACIFSFFHLDPVGFVSRVELGILFGFLYLRTGSLWASMAAHAANNLVSAGIFLASPETEAADQEPTLGLLLRMIAVGLPALILVLAWYVRRPPLPAPAPRPQPPVRAAEILSWLAAAIASIALVAALDFRGIRLNVIDTLVPLPDAEEKQPYEELQALRREARRGEVPISSYLEARRALADELAKHPGTPPPAPKPTPPK